jgi:hypothetical protein
MTLDLPLDVRYRNVDGPLAAYKAAQPWTSALQQEVKEAFERDQEATSLTAPLVATVRYRCPSCEIRQDEIRFESLAFYADEDFHQLTPMGHGELITMVTCGHQFRRELSQ